MSLTPPRLATTLLRWLLPDALRDDALDAAHWRRHPFANRH